MAGHITRERVAVNRGRPCFCRGIARSRVWSPAMERSLDLLVLGHVTRDEIDGDVRLGGAAAFAARAAVALGVETALVTAAPPASPLLDELSGLPRLVV